MDWHRLVLVRAAVFALAAFRDVERDDVIAGLQLLDAGSAFDHFAAAFMAENAGKRAFGIVAGQGEGVGVADASWRPLSVEPRPDLVPSMSISSMTKGFCGSQATAARAFICSCLL
jgi:hypothetical protein